MTQAVGRRLLLFALLALVVVVLVFFALIVVCNTMPGPGGVSCGPFSF